MQVFRVLGAVFIGICALLVIGTVLPMLAMFGGDGFGGLGGFGMMAVVPSVVFMLLPLGIVFLVVASILRGLLGPPPSGIRGGVPAVATVRSTSRTSVRVNRQPVLRIDLDLAVPGHGVVPVSVRRTVPPEHLGAIAPGASLPAVADPANPRWFAIDWARVGIPSESGSDLLGPGGLDLVAITDQLARVGFRLDPDDLAGGEPSGSSGPSGEPEPIPASQLLGTAPGIGATDGGARGVAGGGVAGGSAADAAVGAAGAGGATTVDVTGATLSSLRAVGMAGRGVIREATDLGIAIADGRLFRLRLDVIPSERTGYPAEHVALVPAASQWRIVTGVTLPLFIDRTEPGRLAIDWSA